MKNTHLAIQYFLDKSPRSRADIARGMGVDRSTVTRLTQPTASSLRFHTVAMVCKELGISVDDIIKKEKELSE